MLTTSLLKLNQVTTFRCTGRLVRGFETRILCAAIHQQERELNLDLSEVTAIDAGGIGALLSLQAAGLYLRLINPSPTVREVLRLTKLDSIFEIVALDAASPSTACEVPSFAMVTQT
ncbi:MAG: STAS domain-containing protein [Acidobacteria bacterium]|nr:STAS domain-containing protein [Acidobacteriota bacterium]